MAIFQATGIENAPVNVPLDVGNYRVRVEKCNPITSKNKGTPAVHFELIVEAGPGQVNGSVVEGKKIFWDIWISATGQGNEIGLGKLKKVALITGVPVESNMDLDQFVGKVLIAKLKHEEYNGEKKSVVDSVKKAI